MATALFSVVLKYLYNHGWSVASCFYLSFIINILVTVPYGFADNAWLVLVLRFLCGSSTACTLFTREGLFKLAGPNFKARATYTAGFTAAMGMGYAAGPVVGAALASVDTHVNGVHVDGDVLVGVVAAVASLLLIVHTHFAFAPNNNTNSSRSRKGDKSEEGRPLLAPGSDGEMTRMQQQQQQQQQPMPPTPPPQAYPPSTAVSVSPAPPNSSMNSAPGDSKQQQQQQQLSPWSLQHVLLYTINLTITVTFVAFVTVAVPRMGEIFDWDDSKAGYIEGIVGVTYALSAATNPFFMRTFSPRINFMLSILVTVLANVLMASWDSVDPNIERVIISCFLSGFGYSMTNSLSMKLVGEIARGNQKLVVDGYAYLTVLMSMARVIAPVWTGIMLHYNVGKDLYFGNIGLAIFSCLLVYFMTPAGPGK